MSVCGVLSYQTVTIHMPTTILAILRIETSPSILRITSKEPYQKGYRQWHESVCERCPCGDRPSNSASACSAIRRQFRIRNPQLFNSLLKQLRHVVPEKNLVITRYGRNRRTPLCEPISECLSVHTSSLGRRRHDPFSWNGRTTCC